MVEFKESSVCTVGNEPDLNVQRPHSTLSCFSHLSAHPGKVIPLHLNLVPTEVEVQLIINGVPTLCQIQQVPEIQ